MYGYQNYQGQYQPTPQFNPYAFQPQPVTPSRPAGISGRTVGSASEIMVQDVPTDGTVAWFPLADGSAVIGKRWTPDGNILTMRYVAEMGGSPEQPDPMAALDSKVSEVLSILHSFTGDQQ